MTRSSYCWISRCRWPSSSRRPLRLLWEPLPPLIWVPSNTSSVRIEITYEFVQTRISICKNKKKCFKPREKISESRVNCDRSQLHPLSNSRLWLNRWAWHHYCLLVISPTKTFRSWQHSTNLILTEETQNSQLRSQGLRRLSRSCQRSWKHREDPPLQTKPWNRNLKG